MWLLESEDAFDGKCQREKTVIHSLPRQLADEDLLGRRMWLRPGKTYLFGRTASERELNYTAPLVSGRRLT